jgi:hypothetical protein
MHQDAEASLTIARLMRCTLPKLSTSSASDCRGAANRNFSGLGFRRARRLPPMFQGSAGAAGGSGSCSLSRTRGT